MCEITFIYRKYKKLIRTDGEYNRDGRKPGWHNGDIRGLDMEKRISPKNGNTLNWEYLCSVLYPVYLRVLDKAVECFN